MRKIVFAIACVLGTLPMLANPAYPGKIPYRQPDGTVVYVRQVGDEWYHYTECGDKVVTLDKSGYVVETQKPSYPEWSLSEMKRRQARASVNRAWTPRTDMTIGARRVPVFLIQFQDKEFTTSSDPKTAFYNLLNQEGYSYNGATGSVRDYYVENSQGKFTPTFDIYGPYTVSGNMEDYGGEDYSTGACKALFEACQALDEEIDFSQYDDNSDGYVDMMLFYFAGYNQADGGGTYNTNTIWPHQWHIQYGESAARTTYFDGKRLDRYFCTSEYQGYTGNRRAGIGTTCHEFGHSLGLPDFYDTNYESDGRAGGLYDFSLMCSGSRLNNENTPPYLNTEELQMLGWRDTPEEIAATGAYTLAPIAEQGAYTLPTSMDGEYFLLECRAKTGWDAYLPAEGMLVYQVDKSSRSVSFTKGTSSVTRTAQYLWDSWETYNSINAAGNHPLFRVVPAYKQGLLGDAEASAAFTFPGQSNVVSYLPTDWDGNEGKYLLSTIKYEGGKVTFEVLPGAVPGVYGKVLNSSAKPVKGATVSIYPASDASPAPSAAKRLRISRAPAVSPLATAVTDIDGSFSFALEGQEPGNYELEVSCTGYVSTSVSLSLERRMTEYNVYLMLEGETSSGDLIRYTEGGSKYGFGYGSSYPNMAAAMHFSKEEMGLYQGKQLRSINFSLRGASGSTTATGDVYVFVEVDGVRLFTQEVPSPNFGGDNTVNIINQECIIETPGDTYIGYGIIGSNISQPLLVTPSTEENAGYLAVFDLSEPCDWSLMSYDSTYYTPLISASVGEIIAPDMGFNYIANPGNGVYKAGERFALEVVETEYDTPQSVTWYYDGVLTQASSVSLTAGSHQIEARLGFSDGTTERIYLTIQVQ